MKKIIIIGSGLSGSVCARLLSEKGYLVEIYEVKNHLGGHVYDYYRDNNILVHKYGPHIFHTNYDDVWEFINRFTKFNDYVNEVQVEYDSKLIKFPINFDSIKAIDPDLFERFQIEVKRLFKNETSVSIHELLEKIEDVDLKKLINNIYLKIYANYTIKMWGINIKDIDINVLKRVKINLNHVWNYFPDDRYQGLPLFGYTEMINKILDHKNITIFNNQNAIDFLSFKDSKILFKNEELDVIFTGRIDELFKYEYEQLQYRSLDIQFEDLKQEFFQETAVVNYPAHKSLTRICEYKHMTKQIDKENTTITREYPGNFDINDKIFNIPFYPINNDENNQKYLKYQKDSSKYSNLFLIGRLSEYKYYDMDDVIKNSFELIKKF